MIDHDKEMMKALEADGEKLRQLTGEDHGPVFLGEEDRARQRYYWLDDRLMTYECEGRLFSEEWTVLHIIKQYSYPWQHFIMTEEEFTAKCTPATNEEVGIYYRQNEAD